MSELRQQPTFVATLQIGGDYAMAKQFINRKFYNTGRCVVIQPIVFVYTGGEENGVSVQFVNYPRFPSEIADIRKQAIDLANELLVELNQKTAIVIDSELTTWVAQMPPGANH